MGNEEMRKWEEGQQTADVLLLQSSNVNVHASTHLLRDHLCLTYSWHQRGHCIAICNLALCTSHLAALQLVSLLEVC